MQLYHIKNRPNQFVSLEGATEVDVIDGKKWGKLRYFEIRESKTNAGSPLKTYKQQMKHICLDDLEHLVDVALGPQEIELPKVQEY